jgi:hypothetical protein
VSAENYKRATFIVEPDGALDMRIEGKGPIILNNHQYRLMAMAANEMLTGHAASCWQDKVEDVAYIRVVKRKYLCNNKCTRQGMQSVRTVNPEHGKRIPMTERKKLTIRNSFNFINNHPLMKRYKKT